MLKISPSTANTWTQCPGSPMLSMGLPEIKSPYAKAGTESHARVCAAFTEWDTLGDVTEKTLSSLDDDELEYFEYIKGMSGSALDYGVEKQVKINLAGISPEGILEGTCDFYARKNDYIHIVDKKMPYGHEVNPLSPQLLLYALGIHQERGYIYSQSTVFKFTVWQNGPKTAIIDCECFAGMIEKIRESFLELVPALLNSQGLSDEEWQEKYLIPSESACRYCPAIVKCPKVFGKYKDIQGKVNEILDSANDDLPNMLAQMLPDFPLVERYISQCKALAEQFAREGKEIPGYIWQAGRAGAKAWRDDADIIAVLTQFLPLDQAVKSKPITPAQAFAAIKKHPNKDKIVESLSEIIEVKPPKMSLVSANTFVSQFEEFDD